MLLLGFLVLLGHSTMPVETQGQLSYQVGAWGDDASRGNLGVAAEIQTHAYDSYPGVFDYFWVAHTAILIARYQWKKSPRVKDAAPPFDPS
jgi:hypothetical protein